MICFLLILGIILQNSIAYEWEIDTHEGGHNFGEISLEHSSEYVNGLSSEEYSSEDHSEYPSSVWDSHEWSKTSQLFKQKKPIKGLEAWLADVNKKNKHGFIKPVVKTIAYPVRKDVEIKIPYPQVQQVSQPYPVLVPQLHPVPYEVIKTVVKTVEKKVPTPVEKIVPVPIEKPVPFEVVKHVPVIVEKKFPIKIPIYKTIHHKVH